ncbi:acyl carrier protein [Catenuloplanes indicus]|uniref:Acyl carrier protein n=1 Tax=Catenuloplanes indicus TaxID=137267 RepID=A0AAE3VWA9_9ACTN|nr:acyl carrier protein [Catenuloplanes indicus]MDQ0364916.1 acyl carrier protein [Catenuloplanes indicus]
MSAPAAEVRDAVIRTVSAVLAVDERTVAGTASLTDIDRFNSFRMVEIVERLESELGVEIDADDLIPENLRHVDRLSRLFAAARQRTERS